MQFEKKMRIARHERRATLGDANFIDFLSDSTSHNVEPYLQRSSNRAAVDDHNFTVHIRVAIAAHERGELSNLWRLA